MIRKAEVMGIAAKFENCENFGVGVKRKEASSLKDVGGRNFRSALSPRS